MKLLLLLSSGLMLSDGIMTDFFVRSGLVNEGNRLVEPLVADGSFLLLKIAGVIICGLALWWLYRRFSKAAMFAASGISVFYAMVITWNLGVLIR